MTESESDSPKLYPPVIAAPRPEYPIFSSSLGSHGDPASRHIPIISSNTDNATSPSSIPLRPVVTTPQSDYTVSSSSNNSVSQLKDELRQVSYDKDTLKKELQKVQDKLGSYNKIGLETPRLETTVSMSGVAYSPRTGRVDPPHPQVSASLPEMTMSRSIEQLQTQCDVAMSELEVLQRQHADTVKKCEHAVKEKEYYKIHFRDMSERMEHMENEIHQLKSQCNELTADKQRLEQEVVDLQKLHEQDCVEIANLHKQQREVMNESGSSEVLNKMYDTAIDKYEGVKRENDSLRKQYSDLLASNNVNVENLKLENSRLRKQYSELMGERNAMIEERNGLKQQCTTAIRNWDTSMREKKELQESVSKLAMDRDKYRKEFEREKAHRNMILSERDHLKVKSDTNEREIAMIMSEREEVHKEIKQLEAKLAETSKKNEALEQEAKLKQKEADELRQQYASIQHERDYAVKQISSFKDNYGQMVSRKAEVEQEVSTPVNDCV